MENKTGIYVNDGGRVKEVFVDVEEAEKMYRENHLNVYPQYFFKKMQKLRKWQNAIGEQIAKQFQINSVVDFGCAAGYYLEGFYLENATVYGIEYSYESVKEYIPENMKNFIFGGDVGDKHILPLKYQMSFSVKVAEHILPEKSEQFVDNLVRNSSQYILFSAAENTGGTGHINVKKFDYWVSLFKNLGVSFSSDDTKKLSNIYSTIPFRSKYINFLKRQVKMFRHD